MASGFSPHSLDIHGTSATNGGQVFAGINLGTIGYGHSDNSSCKDLTFRFASEHKLTGSPALSEVLHSLPTAKDAPFSAYKRQHDPTCLRNTRVDLLREIYEWADGEESPSIFWLSGLAGTGKSTIARTVAGNYHAKGRLAASFFFSRAGGDVSHAGKFITTVAFQLANSIPALKSKVCDAINRRNDIASQSLDDQWHELVIGPLSSIKDKEGLSTHVLVVDALDECDNQNSIQIILQRLAEVQSLHGPRLRVLLTSRPEAPIQYGFTQVRRAEYHDFVLHNIEPAIIEQDISVFLRYQLGLIGQKCHFEAGWPEERAIAVLVQNSGGLFIWAATACRFIEEDSRLAETRLSLLLRQEGNGLLPPERKLDEIYTTVLANSVQGEYEAGEIQMLHKLFRQVVGPIVTLQDPLSVSDLAELLGKDVATLRRTLNNLHSVLDLPVDDLMTIRLLHPSFLDFLLDRSRCSDPQYYIDQRLVHRDMYKQCLQTLSKHLGRDICNLQHPAARTVDLNRTEVARHIQPCVQYACRFWVYHYTRSDVDTNRCADVEVFLQKHFLHWLESLALLNRVSDAVYMVHALDSMFSVRDPLSEHYSIWLKLRDRVRATFQSGLNRETNSISLTPYGAPRSNLQAIVHDAAPFVLAFRPILKEAPLQVYYTTLVFSPNTSIVKQTFSNEAPAWLRCMPKVLENWSPCLQTLKGYSDWVTAVAFSPDGKTLASASNDRTIKL